MRGSAPPVAAGCNLRGLLNGITTKTFDYDMNGEINPIYYSSDNCDNAYLLFNWRISNLYEEVDDYYRIHYCIIGHDSVVYKGITSTNEPYILLNLIKLPLNNKNLFEITIRAVIQTYKGTT